MKEVELYHMLVEAVEVAMEVMEDTVVLEEQAVEVVDMVVMEEQHLLDIMKVAEVEADMVEEQMVDMDQQIVLHTVEEAVEDILLKEAIVLEEEDHMVMVVMENMVMLEMKVRI